MVHTERPDERVALTLRPAGARRTPCGRPPGCAGLAPEDVAAAIVANLGRASRTVWVPASMRCVMAALAITPRSIFRRLPL